LGRGVPASETLFYGKNLKNIAQPAANKKPFQTIGRKANFILLLLAPTAKVHFVMGSRLTAISDAAPRPIVVSET
jgi:hypothetical protein